MGEARQAARPGLGDSGGGESAARSGYLAVPVGCP